jgi:hypothetical protein
MIESAAGGQFLPRSFNKMAALMHTCSIASIQISKRIIRLHTSQVVWFPFPLINLAVPQHSSLKTSLKVVKLALLRGV